MASKVIYSAVAVVGIAAASGAAYWYQNKPRGPQEITGAATAASAPLSGASGAGRGQNGPGGPTGVEVAKVEVTRLQDDAQSVGSMRSRQNVMLRPEVAGRVQSMGFTDGARVRKGDVIVQLDDVLQRAEIRQADAQVSIARANLKRNQELVAQSFIAQRVVDESAANMQVVEAQLALACARWDRMRVVAPFDGTVGIRNINIGDYVKDGADLVNIEDLSSMYVDFKLPERFQGKLRRDQQVEIQLDAMPGRTFKATVEAIDPQIDANGRSISVRAVMPNTAGEPLRAPGGPAGAASGARGGASAAAGGRPAARPMAARPAQRPAAGASAPRGGASAARATADTVAAACAPFSTAARAVAGASGAGRPGAGSAPSGGGARGGAGQGAAGQGTGPLRPGMFARVNTVFKVNEASLTVPEEAIVPQGGRQFVIKVVQQTEEQAKVLAEAAKQAASAAAAAGSPAAAASGPGGAVPAAAALTGFIDGKRLVSQRTEVKIGIRRPGRVEILEGVAEGDNVVVAGQQRLQRDNTPVRIVELGRPGGGPGGAAQGQGAGAPGTGGAVGGAIGAASAPAGAAPTANR
jgi:RND family efflux transporter MFP subunit